MSKVLGNQWRRVYNSVNISFLIRLIHAYHMASTEYEKTWERAGWYMHRQYGLSHTIVISNGDGGTGYGYEAFQELAKGLQMAHIL